MMYVRDWLAIRYVMLPALESQVCLCKCISASIHVFIYGCICIKYECLYVYALVSIFMNLSMYNCKYIGICGLNVYVCINGWIDVCIYIHMKLYLLRLLYVYVCINLQFVVCMYVCVYVCMFGSMFVCRYIMACMYMYVCMYIIEWLQACYWMQQ